MSLKTPKNLLIVGAVVAALLTGTILLGNYANIMPCKSYVASQVKAGQAPCCPAESCPDKCCLACPQAENCPDKCCAACCPEKAEGCCPKESEGCCPKIAEGCCPVKAESSCTEEAKTCCR